MADNTDVYAFVDPNDPDFVTLIANFIPLQKPDGGPNFYQFDPNVLYEIHIDNNADAVEDITGIPPVAPNTSGYSNLGVLGGDVGGFPNGRRVGDDVLDIAVRAVAGATPLTPAFNRSPNNTLGDGVNGNDVAYSSVFPYLGLPQPGNR